MSRLRLPLAALLLAGASIACRSELVRQATLTPPAPSPEKTPTAQQIPSPAGSGNELPAGDTLGELLTIELPMADAEDLARRLAGLQGPVPLTLEPPAMPLETGMSDSFWITNARDEKVQIRATLQAVTDHAYFWVQDGVRYRQRNLVQLADTFEEQIYPTTREFFGSEWTPGIDGDPHIYVLYAGDLGSGIAGYFLPGDMLHPLVNEFSNGHEMFLFNADTMALADDDTYSVLAHEFQHMIHWNIDRDEDTWVNEGLSELAVWLNGFDVGGFHELYLADPDLQLNDWPNSDDTAPHYGSSFLFMSYLLDRLGREITSKFVSHPANGLKAVDLVLAENDVRDPDTGVPMSAEDLIMDWALANYLNLDEPPGARYSYSGLPDFRRARTTEEFSECTADRHERTVSQYGVDYILIDCPGLGSLVFEGSQLVPLLPAVAHSGDRSYWSNKGDELDSRLTHAFDFTQLSSPITMSYWTWYDIERDWDYVYVLASEDGERWDMLRTPEGTDANPTGNNYGWGYTGVSPGSGWIHETVDLSAYAGQEIYIRFEYVTDGAKFGEGFLLDDLAIPEIGYASDFEADSGGWEAEGFIPVTNTLPQGFRLALITQNGEAVVERIALDGINRATIPMDLSDGEFAVLVVMGTTRFTRHPAGYTISFQP